jgi:hypothetical protein
VEETVAESNVSHEDDFQFHTETFWVHEREAFVATLAVSEVAPFGTPLNVTVTAACGELCEELRP